MYIEKYQITNVILNDYILKYSAAVALIYITKYQSKTFQKFKIHSVAKIDFCGMRNDHNHQAKGLWRILIRLWHISVTHMAQSRNFSWVQ